MRLQARELKNVHANSKLVLRQDPASLSPRAAAAYVLRIPSNLVLIAASALGYFFLAGLQAFAVLFAETRYGISQTLVVFVLVAAGAGGVFGTLYAGRLTDSLIRKGVADARLLVAGVAFVASAATFLPGLVSSSILISGPRFRHRGCLCRPPDPPLDAARLDVVPSRLRGQAEAVRTFAATYFRVSPRYCSVTCLRRWRPHATVAPRRPTHASRRLPGGASSTPS